MGYQTFSEDNLHYLTDCIQTYGYLLIVDQDLTLVSISENCSSWLDEDVNSFLGSNLNDLISEHLPGNYQNLQKGIDQVISDYKERVWLEVLVKAEECYLNIYSFDGFIYLEFEKKSLDNSVFFPKFESFNRLLNENKDHIWEVVCGYIAKISGFDRVRVFQYDEDENGIVISEFIGNEALAGIKDCYYPNIDVFKFAKQVHSVNASRYSAQVDGPTVRMLSIDGISPSLQQTGIRSVLPLHAEYLIRDGVNSNMSMGITVKGKLWGYIFCQSQEAKRVSLLKREAMLSFIQMAMNAYEDTQRILERKWYEEIKNFELLLKEQLILNRDLSEVLKQLGEKLCAYADADAMVILSEGNMFNYKIEIGKIKANAIVDQISSLTKDHYFADHEFVLKYGKKLGLNFERFAGVAGIDVLPERGFTILFFKREVIQKRKWVEKPEELMNELNPFMEFEREPHPKFQIWHQTTYKRSTKWTKNEMFFFERLRNIITDSFKRLAQEISLLNNEVFNLNKALDDYANTVSHDIKNPLSAINLSTQMMMQKLDMNEDLRHKMLKNTKDAVKVITDMLTSIHEFSKVKGYDYKMEPVYPVEFIPQIVEFSKIRYSSESLSINLGHLMPIYGEKTIIYQLFQNFIGNAVKYSAKSIAPKVTIHSELDHEFVRYTIEDNGIGIAKEELSNIFDSFKRLSNAVDYEGTGLGLSIARRIADRLNVQIKIDSELGEGTKIVLLFPNEN